MISNSIFPSSVLLQLNIFFILLIVFLIILFLLLCISLLLANNIFLLSNTFGDNNFNIKSLTTSTSNSSFDISINPFLYKLCTSSLWPNRLIIPLLYLIAVLILDLPHK